MNMQKSIIERVFPHPKRSPLPRYEASSSPYHDDEPDTAHGGQRIKLSSNVSRASTSANSRRSSESKGPSRDPLQPAPLSASIVHHDAPFLAVDRAAAALQKTIQSLLDFQSQALSGRHEDQPDTSSQRSTSPALSRTTLSTSARQRQSSAAAGAGGGGGVVPVRQPKEKKKSLRGARRGLVRSMQEFAALKQDELQITESEAQQRRKALQTIADLESKKDAVQHKIQSLQDAASGNAAGSLRSEAQSVEQEIHELEIRLMELRVRHKHLIDRATEVENTAASELSSYQGTLKLIDQKILSFLRRPPVKQSLGPRNASQPEQGQDMYALRPERRTLELAKEQWTSELELLETQKADSEKERAALLQGAAIWKETIEKIDEFEHRLRVEMNTGNPTATADIVSSIDTVMRFLHEKLAQAESHSWNLLICAVGAELEAFKQARAILVPEEPPLDLGLPLHANGVPSEGHDEEQHEDEDENHDVPFADLLGADSPELTASAPPATAAPTDGHNLHTNISPSNSNESLKATLRGFPSAAMTASRLDNQTLSTSKQLSSRPQPRYSESEDDEPGPDFLVSH